MQGRLRAACQTPSLYPPCRGSRQPPTPHLHGLTFNVQMPCDQTCKFPTDLGPPNVIFSAWTLYACTAISPFAHTHSISPVPFNFFITILLWHPCRNTFS